MDGMRAFSADHPPGLFGFAPVKARPKLPHTRVAPQGGDFQSKPSRENSSRTLDQDGPQTDNVSSSPKTLYHLQDDTQAPQPLQTSLSMHLVKPVVLQAPLRFHLLIKSSQAPYPLL
ncbi:Hypothetical predicted protein [Marmota monax]|uniref:Uncharacterized protein n=1 Tax=Marmota monax TaxID=9995 RepID=A0A5E4AWE3_MARMO|nr:hypothetical protein GHT09_013236 [Marmota monax]VTJ61694.1 Hypothetical predicted protein [Marmota monax]